MRDAPRRRRSRTLQVESLESVTLLSGFARPGLVHAARAAVCAVNLNGAALGYYTIPNAALHVADAPQTYLLYSNAQLLGVGRAFAYGYFNTLGFIDSARETGKLVVSAPRGNLNLTLTGPLQPGNSGPPPSFTYAINGGTGAYRNASGAGTLKLVIEPYRPPSPTADGLGRLAFVFQPGTAG